MWAQSNGCRWATLPVHCTAVLEHLLIQEVLRSLAEPWHLATQPFSRRLKCPSRFWPICWLQLARILDANRDQYDAFLVAHGTDTMA
jgi:hypothetical protein